MGGSTWGGKKIECHKATERGDQEIPSRYRIIREVSGNRNKVAMVI